MKKVAKIFLYVLLIVVAVYLIFAFWYGGFGKKPVVYTPAGQEGKTLLFAHRGISLYYPENSLECIEGARKNGFRATEVDIRRSADQQLIIFHDENCARLLGLDKNVNTVQLAELQTYPILLSGKKSNAFISTVEELLTAEKENMVYYFDSKLSSFKDADEIVSLIKKHGCERSVILANANAPFIFYVEANYPEIMTVLEGFNAGKEWIWYFIPKDLKPDFVSGFYSETDADHVNWLKEHDLLDSKIVYGVDLTNYDAALKTGFKNILIDFDSVMYKDARIAGMLKQ